MRRGSRVRNGRVLIFIAIAIACVLVGGGYGVYAYANRDAASGKGGTHAVPTGDAVVFKNAGLGAEDRRLGWAALGGAKHLTDVYCDRVYYAAKKGICLTTNDTRTGFVTKFFDDHLRVTDEMPAGGIPSRARISRDGRYGVTTVFVLGHDYSDGTFSTETTLIDMTTRSRVAHMEEFSTFLDGKKIDAPDVNYWGVTFVPGDSNRFYATLGTGGHTYLIKGDIAARTADVLRDGVECPSLSPDGTRIAFKHEVGANLWKIHVMNVDDLRDRPVAEARSIDDQVEWLDNDTLSYAVVEDDIYKVPADGSGSPVVLLEDATSLASVR